MALHHYLSWHSIVPAPRTILRGVGKLPPATVLTIEPDGTRRQRVWWDPPFERPGDRARRLGRRGAGGARGRRAAADGGRRAGGILKAAPRGIVPDAVIDRPKGYFPVPALSHLEGPVLELAGDALRSSAARDRGLFRAGVVEAMLREPNVHRTNLDGSTLWQLALLELWLQTQLGG